MSQKQDLMTTAEFARKSGIPTAKVSELIRAGKIKAKKVSGRWQIAESQLKVEAVSQYGKSAPVKKKSTASKAASKPVKAKAAAPKVTADSKQKTYSVTEFAAMTYLTEKGVMEWLKTGRLRGQQESGGEWSIDAENLQVADISRLVRE